MCDDIEVDASTHELLVSFRASQIELEERMYDAQLEATAMFSHTAELAERERARVARTTAMARTYSGISIRPGLVATAAAATHLKCPFPDCTHARLFKKNYKGTSKPLQNHINNVHLYRAAKTYYIYGYTAGDGYLNTMMGAYTSGTHKSAPIINGAPVYYNNTKRCLFRLQTGHWMISDERDMRLAQVESPIGYISSSNRDFDVHDPLDDINPAPPQIFTPKNLTWNFSKTDGWSKSDIKVILFEKGDPVPILPAVVVDKSLSEPDEDLARELFPESMDVSPGEIIETSHSATMLLNSAPWPLPDPRIPDDAVVVAVASTVFEA